MKIENLSKTILHVDINSYFATLLQQENPSLRGKPIGIVKDIGRTCVIAASKEAKQFGVKTGCTTVEARQRCPQIQFLPAQFDRYLDATKRLKAVFESVAPDVFIYSLDEAFIDITDCQQYLYAKPLQVAETIQCKIKQELGEWVTCNVGIGPNRFLAKMASETAPKGSILEVNDGNKDLLLASVTFENTCGIGFRLEQKLKLLHVHHPYQIRFFSFDQLLPLFGPFWARELLKMAYGEEPHHLQLLDQPLPHMKSVGRSITGYRLYDDETEIKAILLNLTEEVTAKVRAMRLAGRFVNLHLWGHDRSFKAHRTLQYFIRHTPEMFGILYDQLYTPWHRPFRIIKFAVRLSLLEPVGQLTQPLLPQVQKQERLSQALDAVNRKYGLSTAFPATLLGKPLIRPEVTGFLGDRDYQLTHT
jgi:DNA polymerase-4